MEGEEEETFAGLLGNNNLIQFAEEEDVLENHIIEVSETEEVEEEEIEAYEQWKKDE